MTNANSDMNLIKKILKTDNLATLTPQEREEYYLARCEMLSLDPLSKPFSYLELKDNKTKETKLTLYMNKNASEQLRGKLKMKFQKPEFKKSDCGEYLQAEVMFELPDGRVEFATAAVPLIKEEVKWEKLPDGSSKRVVLGKTPLSPDEKANAVMRLETKLKNRATMSAMGSGMLDESELDTMSDYIVKTSSLPTPPIPQEPKVDNSKSPNRDKEIMDSLSNTKLSGLEVTEELFFVYHRNKAEFEKRFGLLPSPKTPEGNRFWLTVGTTKVA